VGKRQGQKQKEDQKYGLGWKTALTGEPRLGNNNVKRRRHTKKLNRGGGKRQESPFQNEKIKLAGRGHKTNMGCVETKRTRL